MTTLERGTDQVVRDTLKFIFRVLKGGLGLVSKRHA